MLGHPTGGGSATGAGSAIGGRSAYRCWVSLQVLGQFIGAGSYKYWVMDLS